MVRYGERPWDEKGGGGGGGGGRELENKNVVKSIQAAISDSVPLLPVNMLHAIFCSRDVIGQSGLVFSALCHQM